MQASSQRQCSLGLHRITHITGALQLQVEPAVKRRGQPLRSKRGRFWLTGKQGGTDCTMPRAGKRNQPLCRSTLALFEPLDSDLGAVAMWIFKISTRDQLAQIQIAGAVLHQHRHAGGVIAIKIVGDPQITADDRLDTAFARRQVKAHCTEHVGAVGKRKSALPVRRRLSDRIVDSNDAVDDRKFRMQAKMYKLRAAHRYDFAIAIVRKLWITDRWRHFPRIPPAKPFGTPLNTACPTLLSAAMNGYR